MTERGSFVMIFCVGWGCVSALLLWADSWGLSGEGAMGVWVCAAWASRRKSQLPESLVDPGTLINAGAVIL
jgi:hypothetical protein